MVLVEGAETASADGGESGAWGERRTVCTELGAEVCTFFSMGLSARGVAGQGRGGVGGRGEGRTSSSFSMDISHQSSLKLSSSI